MPRARFDARNVRTFSPRPGRDQDYYWDTAPNVATGFGVRVSAQGVGDPVRSYVLAYRIHGRKRFLKLGRVEDLDLLEARRRAREEASRVNGGEDPQARRQELREADCVAELVEQFINSFDRLLVEPTRSTAGTKSLKTTREYRSMLKSEIKKSDFGRLGVRQATRGEARIFLEAIARRAPVLANRVYQLVRAAFAWAVREERAQLNPLEGLGRPRKEQSRDRVLSVDELRALWTALETTEEEEGLVVRLVPVVVAAAVRVIVMVGTRRTETFTMRWLDVDLDGGLWSIPGSSRKGGEPLTIPLPAQAVREIRALESLTGREEWVFAGTRGASIAANPGRVGAQLWKAYEVAAKKLKVRVDDWTLHDLRRTCATGCGELGAPPHVVALILGHHTMPGAGRVTHVYDRAKRVREVAPWLASWAAQVERIVSGEERRADVVAITRTSSA